MNITDEFFIKAFVLAGTAIVLAVTCALWALEVLRKKDGPHIRSRGREVRR